MLIMCRDSGVASQLHHPRIPGQKPCPNARAKALIFHGVLARFWTGHKPEFMARVVTVNFQALAAGGPS